MNIFWALQNVDNTFVEGYVKVRDYCHVTEKYRGAAHRYCSINVSLNYKIPIVFYNLKKYDTHLIMQELGKIWITKMQGLWPLIIISYTFFLSY